MDAEKGTAKVAPRQSRAAKLLDAKVDVQIEKLVKSLNSESTSEKMLILAKQAVEAERESSRRALLVKQNEKNLETVQREKENLQKEYNKGVLMRDKLEQVCREQQKLMKSIKAECTSRIREEEEKRKETQAHFQKSINEIFTTLGKNNEENAKLKEANLEMTKKFKYLAEQYELREQQLGKINEQIQLESQLNEAKLAKTKMESTIEKEILLKEKEAVLLDLMSTKQAIIDMQEREKALKGQLNMYTEKYAEFQSSLKKSNDVFSTYKTEIESMSKRTKSLEKESNEWRNKYDKCNRALLNMVGDKQAQDAYVAKSARQIAQLQKLCRTLQAERTGLLDVLTANNIERPPMPELPPAPTDIEPPPRSADKLDLMSRNCMELKRSLALLQGQMHALETKETPKPAAEQTQKSTAAAAATGKKAKNKKAKSKTAPQKNTENGDAEETTATPTEIDDADAVAATSANGNISSPNAEQSIANGNGVATPDAEPETVAVVEPNGDNVATESAVVPVVEAEQPAADSVPAVAEALAECTIVA